MLHEEASQEVIELGVKPGSTEDCHVIFIQLFTDGAFDAFSKRWEYIQEKSKTRLDI